MEHRPKMTLFLSTFVNKVDAKGRVSVPAQFRSTLQNQEYQGIVAFRSYRLGAIDACGLDRMALLSNSVDQMDLFSEAQDDFSSVLFADAHQLPFDGDGRIMLPEGFKTFAGITNEAAFVGRGAMFQIWEPKTFKKHQEESLQRLLQRGATLTLKP